MTAHCALVVLAAAATLGGDDDADDAANTAEWGAPVQGVDRQVAWLRLVLPELPGVVQEQGGEVLRGRTTDSESTHVLIIPGLARGDAHVTTDGGPVVPIGGE